LSKPVKFGQAPLQEPVTDAEQTGALLDASIKPRLSPSFAPVGVTLESDSPPPFDTSDVVKKVRFEDHSPSWKNEARSKSAQA
jgi:hypothetical protein